MPTFLPNKLDFLEYKPSMQGVPVEAMANTFDRMDKTAIRAEESASTMKEILVKQMAISLPGDKGYLQGMFNDMEATLNAAVESNNLPGYAKRIRSLVSSFTGDSDYQVIAANGKRYQKYIAAKDALEMQHGKVNVVTAGDGSEMASHDANGEPQQFMGSAYVRPNYDNAKAALFEKGADSTSSEQAVTDWVVGKTNANGDFEVGTGYLAYSQTPEGRLEQDELAREHFGLPFHRLQPEEQTKIALHLTKEIENAGHRIVRTGRGTGSGSGSGKATTANTPISWSGATTMVGDDDESTGDQVVGVWDDNTKDSDWDKQLQTIFGTKKEIGNLPEYGGTAFSPSTDKVTSVQMSSGRGPNGFPVVRVNYNEGTTDDKSKFGYSYTEISEKDISTLRGGSALSSFIAQMNNGLLRGEGLDSLLSVQAVIMDPDLATLGRKENPATSYENRQYGITVKKTANGFAVFHNGKPATKNGRVLPDFINPEDVQSFMGLVFNGQIEW